LICAIKTTTPLRNIQSKEFIKISELIDKTICWPSHISMKEIKMFSKSFLALTACLFLAACGTSKGDRALSGGAIGAGVGAVGSSAAGGSATTGGVLGGAVGAATGVLTDEDDINLD
jgi:hypothetical protein